MLLKVNSFLVLTISLFIMAGNIPLVCDPWFYNDETLTLSQRKGHCVAICDLNNDDNLDLVLGGELDAVWMNTGKTTGRISFELKYLTDTGINGLARDITYGDVNNDGLLDILVADGKHNLGNPPIGEDEYRLYINQYSGPAPIPPATPTPPNNYIEINVKKLVLGNKVHAVGSKIELINNATGDTVGYDEVRTDVCYRSKRPFRLHFGLGQVSSIKAEITYIDKNKIAQIITINNLIINKVNNILLPY